MHTIAVDGGNLAYVESGSGTPVVLIHGFPLDHSIWDAIAHQIEARARIVRPDLRGLGVSAVTPGPYLMELLASDIAALLDALGIERAAIVGHSLGGYVALAFYRMYRERVSALALVASRVSADSAEIANDRHVLADRAEREGIEPIVERFLPRLFAARLYESDPALVSRTKSHIERMNPHGAAALLRGMAARVSSHDLLEDIDVPFLLVAGEADALLDFAEARATVQKVVGGTFERIEDAGHMPMLEAPHRLARTLEAFIERVG